MAASTVKLPLFVLSLAYAGVVRSLAFLHGLRPVSFPLKVISVGNITLGGTGKTVLVQYLARFFLEQGAATAVLSRGYMGGDEPGMLKKQLPGLAVFADHDRVRSLKRCEERGIRVAILDDGFQQWRIRKDLDIVCVDAGGFGNRCLIPRGLLREPLSSLKRAHVFVVTNTRLVSAARAEALKVLLHRINPKALLVGADHQPKGVFKASSGEAADPRALGRACLVCGIGNPGSFFESCASTGIARGPQLEFPDHHRYTAADISRIASVCRREGVTAVVTTEKDEVRLPAPALQEHGLELYTLRVGVRIMSNEQEFSARLRGLLPA